MSGDFLTNDVTAMLKTLTPEEAKGLWFHRIGQDEFDAIYARLVPESPSVINEYSSGAVQIDRDAVNCPILVVGSEFDRTTVHHPRAIADFYRAELTIVPDCGHDLMLEPAAEEAAARIERWLLSNCGG